MDGEEINFEYPILLLQFQDRSMPRVWYDMIYIRCKTILTRSLQRLLPICHAMRLHQHSSSCFRERSGER